MGLFTVADPVAEAGAVVGTVAAATLLVEMGVDEEAAEELEPEALQLRS